MKSLLLKTQITALLLFSFIMVFAQNSMKIPQNAVFYMEINGNQLNKKINWEKFNPFLKEITKEKDKQPSWNDYSKTGIKYDATQYHYATFNDSVQAYNAHFIIENKEKFQEFISSTKKKGQEVSKKNNYSYIDISDDTFVAWNNDRAFLTMINYNKPSKDIWTDYNVVDSTAVTADSAVAVVDSAASVYEEEKPFDYKEEIQYLKDEIKYLKENIKTNNEDIIKYQKDIKYLEKHHKYPEAKEESGEVTDSAYSEKEMEGMPPPASQDDYETEMYEEDSAYQKEMDSLNIEKFKIVKKIAENNFDQYFSSNFEIEVPKEMLSFRDANSDVFAYTDYGKIMNEGVYGKMFRRVDYTQFLQKMYNSNASYNLYFDKDKVRLVNNYQHKNTDIQKAISDVYKGKKNKKLTALITDKSVGYYAMNVNGYKCFDMMYSFFQDAGEKEYQKEFQLMIETMKIVLDEEAISKIAPGNGIFVLNELKSKKVEYTDYDYDEDYNEKEIKKTKDVMVPDFTFAFATENEDYWRRIFDVLTTNKDFAKKFSKNGNIYVFKEGTNQESVDQLFFTVKNGIVYLTTSMENLTEKNQSEVSKKWMKDSAKYPLSGRLDIQKLLVGLEQEFKTGSERKTLNLLRKNVGDVYFKTEVKGESIQTEMDYNIKNSSDNSLMYFFDLFDEIYKNIEADKKPQTL
ncbi:hypothetical protein CHRY9390_01339 [Chryseobacterium aquaeductus]|uniref:DUF4836 domain-containing protein n=1 Tax=Chryseobacterium aquaeductus TaxID=2675056 RepID=A0A9N8MN24_9FLAO|nr:hypothetical protein [Chryseobacterium aquaeductus]CAA7330668.1 hypothetical protein CHRY9390_01339 [Chryseobacterium potabilaquae]CAD7805248.1 hypothetical protein CHRY9390_01339 [Chryseobacterium aquaeductus]